MQPEEQKLFEKMHEKGERFDKAILSIKEQKESIETDLVLAQRLGIENETILVKKAYLSALVFSLEQLEFESKGTPQK